MVVIPARNEAGSIGVAVRSLPPDSVIVVDDFSDDKTADEARDAGAGVLSAPPPLDGAVGKSNACIEGARVLTSRWILFADADTRFKPGAVEAMVAAADARQIDFLSVYLKPEFKTLSESAIAPYGVALYFCGIDARANPASAFNGQCVLVKRDAYEFVGGHRAVRGYVCEDVKMAALAQRHRLKFATARAPKLGSVRIHPSDFARNAVLQLAETHLRPESRVFDRFSALELRLAEIEAALKHNSEMLRALLKDSVARPPERARGA